MDVIEDHHMPIIPKDIFEEAQKKHAERTNLEIGEDGTVRRRAKKYSSVKLETEEKEKEEP